ncbi:replicative DNA helicase [Nanchangia anserum]|uniref:Replicative DNA helicase n=1 Tax=Nanchangia anserum TaxID=2692125 RepID=A0A8I0GCA5_9ACTO|nr:replicative DNA helicase [Nanchangia anserum]MBD3689641.1 replicative DNA helicase [Nanchangia anserum]QOX81823.1 replicative DNA helicase [Nanchangia anserum]
MAGDELFDRIPPNDRQAEESVLGAMMLSKDAIAEVTMEIRGTDYYHMAHQIIHNAIVDLYGRGEPADAVTVAAQLERDGDLKRIDGASYLHYLTTTVPTAANAGYYARIVKERSQLRRLVEVGTRIVQLGYADDGGDVDTIVNQAQAEVYAVTEQDERSDYSRVAELLDPTLEELQAIEQNGNEQAGVPTGFIDLDSLTNGLHGGQMIIVAARPAMGKSTFAVDICRAASIKHKVTSVIFSLEMGLGELTMRILSAESGVYLEKMRGGKMEQRDWQRLMKAVGALEEAPLFLDESTNISMTEIRSKCRRLKQQHNLGLIVIDYLQLMTSGRKVESRQQEVSEFSRSLKLLAKELDVPVIAVAQLNRGPEARTDHKPMLSDLRESGSLEQDADVVLLLNRPEVYNPEDRPGEADIIVAKHRNGRTATVVLSFQGQAARFTDMARE